MLSRSRTGKGEMTAGVSALIVSKITFQTLDLLKSFLKFRTEFLSGLAVKNCVEKQGISKSNSSLQPILMKR